MERGAYNQIEVETRTGTVKDGRATKKRRGDQTRGDEEGEETRRRIL